MNSLFIFTKPNRMGVSKTRLAREIGFAEAQRINAMSTARVMRNAADPRWQTALMVAPDSALETRQPLWPNTLARISQGEGDLGARMSRAFDLAPLGNVLMIGTDMPDLSRALIGQAIRLLRSRDAVFGPADDGGFWLFGQKKRSRSKPPFQNVRWSSPHALADVVRNLGPARIGYLPEMIDFDDADALRTWRRRT